MTVAQYIYIYIYMCVYVKLLPCDLVQYSSAFSPSVSLTFKVMCFFFLHRGKIVLGYTEEELCYSGSGYQFIHAADMLYCAENHIRSKTPLNQCGSRKYTHLTRSHHWVSTLLVSESRGLTVVEIISLLLKGPFAQKWKIIYSSSCCSKTLRYSKHKLPKIGFVFSQHIDLFIKVHIAIIFTLLKVQKDIIKMTWSLYMMNRFNLGFHSWINIDRPTCNLNMLVQGMRTNNTYVHQFVFDLLKDDCYQTHVLLLI